MKHEIIYYENGNKQCEYYCNDLDQYHNEVGPAYISYYLNGSKASESYWMNGIHHNMKGPSYIQYDENNNVKLKLYYINDVEINVSSDEEFNKYIKLLSIG